MTSLGFTIAVPNHKSDNVYQLLSGKKQKTNTSQNFIINRIEHQNGLVKMSARFNSVNL